MGKVKDEDLKYLLSLTADDLTKSRFIELFVTRLKTPARYNMGDEFQFDLNGSIFERVSPVSRVKRKTVITTNVGRYVFNVMMLHPNAAMYRSTGYVNDVITDDSFKGIQAKVSEAILDGAISVQDAHDFLDQAEYYSYGILSLIFNPTVTMGLVSEDPDIQQLKNNLIKKYEKELKADVVSTTMKIEDELISSARKKMENDPGMDIYESGARGSFGNNFKLLTIMRGITQSPTDPSKFNLIKSNLSGGFGQEDFHHFANIATVGSYSRGVNTQKGGYLGKMYAGFQSVVLADKGSDCKTKMYLPLKITPQLIKAGMLKYRYIVEGKKLVQLTTANINSYLGKTVMLRSGQYCKQEDGYCNICAGDLFYKLDTKNIGLLFSRSAGILLNISMKSFHDQTIRTSKININDYIRDI